MRMRDGTRRRGDAERSVVHGARMSHSAMQRILVAALAAFVLGCQGDAQPIAVRNSGLAHHEVRAESLPLPFDTPSSSNPPWVGSRPSNATLRLPPRFHIAVFATGLSNPRNLLLLPNGDVMVAETESGRITILRDADGNGTAERTFTFTKDVNEPFGLALRGPWLYVGDTDAVIRFPYRPGDTSATGSPQRLASLPTGGHSTRNLIFNRDGSKLFVSVGSSSNDSIEGPSRAAILEFGPEGKPSRTFASGLRNPVGLALNPTTGALWTSVNERDGLGDDLAPDFITEVTDGGFYGFPYVYAGKHEDPRHRGERPDLVARSLVPSVLIQAHSAPLGMVFYDGAMFPSSYRGSAFVALHGSWNRSRRTGYEVIRVDFRGGKAVGGYDDFVAGWMPDESSGHVWGRPVALLVLRDGSLLIADDGANVIWRVTYR